MTAETIIDIPRAAGSATLSPNVFEDDTKVTTGTVDVAGKSYTYVFWGRNNNLPYEVKRLVEKNSVMSQNKFFNVLTCYGRGLEYMDSSTLDDEKPRPTRDPEIREFLIRNSMKRFFAEQIFDLKYFFFSVAVLILSRDNRRIVKVVHKEACHCRFEKAENGRVRNVIFADWEDNNSPSHAEVIPLLDEQDPYGDLLARTGKRKDELGYFRAAPASCHKYAIVCRIPTVGSRYYPVPAYSAAFRDGWYDIYRLLTEAKRAKIRNGQSIRYHVEINTQFWEDRARAKGITIGTVEFENMKDEFIKELKKYLSGSENSDKLLWSEFQSLIDGKERHFLKVNVVDTSKAGSEYNDDVAEASNVLCYDDNVHPNLAGAVPGKAQMNNSGSDKRELFTMKQSLETLPHDIMMTVHNTIIYFNGWEDRVEPVVPLILLTTLDKKTDAVEGSTNNQQSKEGGNL